MLAAKDIYWVAGLLEGEGCFGNRAGGRQLNIQCRMTDADVLDRLQALVGGRRIGPYESGRPNEKPMYGWVVVGVKAAGLMMTLLPLLGLRRRARVEGLLAEWRCSLAKPHMRRQPFVSKATPGDVVRLREQGLTFTEVGAALGIGRSTAQTWFAGDQRG